MAYTCLVYCPVCLRVLRYPLVQLLRDICLPVLTATVVGVAMLALSHFLPTGSVWENMGCLSVQFVVAVSLVAAIAWVFRARAAREILMVVRDKVPVHGAWWTYVSRHFKLEG